MRSFLLKLSVVAALFSVSSTAMAWDWGYLVQGGVKLLQAQTLSDSEVKQYVAAAVKEMDAKANVAPAKSPYTVRLNKLTQGITSAEGVPLNFKVYMTNEVNAFACADGSVRVYSGIMDVMSDDELLGIIGHEVGHVAKKHTKKAMKAALVNSALLDGVTSYGGFVGALASSSLGTLTETLANSKYSRKQEEEADDYGYKFLKNNGRNPWAMAMSFEKLKSLESQSAAMSTFINKMFSDHPDTDARIKRMSKKAQKDGFVRPAK